MVFCSRKAVRSILRAEPFESLFQVKLIKGQPQSLGSSDPAAGVLFFSVGTQNFLEQREKKVMQQTGIRFSFLMKGLHGSGEGSKMCLFGGFLPSTLQKTKIGIPSVLQYDPKFRRAPLQCYFFCPHMMYCVTFVLLQLCLIKNVLSMMHWFSS